MGKSKSESFTEEQQQLAKIAKAMGHPARIAIIDFLLKENRCIGKGIVEEIPLAQPTISRHLKELKEAGLIQGEIEGTAVCYCLDIKGFALLKKYSLNILENLNNCC